MSKTARQVVGLIIASVLSSGCDERPPPRGDARVDARSDAGPLGPCGNGRIDGSESCDGSDLGGRSCDSLGLIAGALRCDKDCRLDYSGCTSCGDGKLQGSEVCDGAELGGATCTSLGQGFTAGKLACSKACQYDVQGCASGVDGHATLIFGTASGLFERRLDTRLGSWSPKVQLPAITGTPMWVVNRIAPPPSTEEVAAVSTVTASGLLLHLLRRDSAGAWNLLDVTSLGVPASEASKRPFDLIYEAAARRAMLVYSDNTSNPVYRVLSGGGLSAPQKVFSTAPAVGVVRWVVLAARAGSDDITLVHADKNTLAFAALWNGKSFTRLVEATGSTTIPLEMGPSGLDGQSFDATYERVSGDLLLVHASTAACYGSGYMRAGSTTVRFDGSACASFWSFVHLAPQRGSDAAAIVGDWGSVAIWDSASWHEGTSIYAGPGYQPGRPSRWADVAWVGIQPTAVVVQRGWTDKDAPDGRGRIYWLRSGVGGTWTQETPVDVPGLGEVIWPQLKSYPAEDRVLAVFSDDLQSLWSATFELAKGWKVSGGGPLTTKDLPATTAARPFSVDIAQP